MTIHLKLGGQLRTTIGQETIAIEIAEDGETNLGVVLKAFAKRHEKVRDMLLKADGTVAGGLLVLIDDAATSANCELAVDESVNITLLPAISGG